MLTLQEHLLMPLIFLLNKHVVLENVKVMFGIIFDLSCMYQSLIKYKFHRVKYLTAATLTLDTGSFVALYTFENGWMNRLLFWNHVKFIKRVWLYISLNPKYLLIPKTKYKYKVVRRDPATLMTSIHEGQQVASPMHYRTRATT